MSHDLVEIAHGHRAETRCDFHLQRIVEDILSLATMASFGTDDKKMKDMAKDLGESIAQVRKGILEDTALVTESLRRNIEAAILLCPSAQRKSEIESKPKKWFFSHGRPLSERVLDPDF